MITLHYYLNKYQIQIYKLNAISILKFMCPQMDVNGHFVYKISKNLFEK